METLDAIGAAIHTEQRVLDRLTGEAQHIAGEGKRLEAEVAELEESMALFEKAIGVLHSFGEQQQVALQRKVETLITHGLQTIFGQDLSFHIVTKQQGKLMAMDFLIRSTSGEEVVETPVLEARGGGVAAVAGFLLRLIVLLLQGGKAAPVLFLDETFAQLSAEYEPRLAEFIRELVDKTQVQIVLITHSEAYSEHADEVYRFKLTEGVTEISRLRA